MKAYSFFWPLIVALLLGIHPLFGVPAVSNLSPFVGPSSGGTSVAITGSGFTGATAVSFGAVPAASFIVNSDISISAVSPLHSPQVVPVTVTTGSGTSPVTHDSLFVYQGDVRAYVANYNSGNISVIDTASDSVVTTISVGSNPRAIAILPDGTKAYVANNGSDTVSVINTSDNTLITTIPVGNFPYALAITPDGAKAFVVNSNSGTVQVINTVTDLVSATITVESNPSAINITPDGTKAYVANSGSNTVSVIDAINNLLLTNIPVGNFPIAIAITPDGTKAVVVNNNSGSVSIITTASDTVSTTLAVGNNPCAIAITPDGTKAYVANRNSMSISVINMTNNSISGTITVENFPDAIAITSNGAKAYAVNNNSGTVSVITTANNTVSATLTIGSNPCAIVIIPDGSKAYVTNNSNGDISVIDTASNAVSAIATGNFSEAIAVMPDQAPLANFTFNSADSPITFDASSSISPSGGISNYFWDFGDGNTLNTPLPTTVHVYPASGNYSISLTVTNSAGTSTTQLYHPSTSNDLSFNSAPITHNGGSSAVTMQTTNVNVFILPPTQLQVKQTKRIFLTQTDLINILTWQAPSAGNPPAIYKIYRNAALTHLAGVVSANQRLEFEDNNRKKDHTYQYFVVSEDQFGNQSVPAEVTVKEKS